MQVIKDLISLFIKSLKFHKANQKRGKAFFIFLIIISIIFVFIPFLLIFTIFIYDMIRQLEEASFASLGFEVLLGLMAIFSFIFSFPVLLNELYFSEDIDGMLPLPIKPQVLAFTKFSSCYIIENVILFIILFFACCSYILGRGLSFIKIIFAIPGILLFALIPMIYASIILFILMNLLKFVKNKRHIKRLGLLFVFVLVIGVYFLFHEMSHFQLENFVEDFANGNHNIVFIFRRIFPSIQFFVSSIDKSSILSIILLIGINLLFIGVFILVSKYWYYDGVIGLSSKDTYSRKSSIKEISNIKVHEPFYIILLKDIKFLFRSPTFFLNCMVINIIWPIFLFLIFRFGLANYTISHMRELIILKDQGVFVAFILSTLGVSIMVPTFNSIASSSFSREGKNFHFIKYIPYSYGLTWRGKYLVSMIISLIGIFMYMIPFYIMVHFSFIWILIFIIISILGVSCVSLIGICIDSCYPKLIWDDEADALRENTNAFMAMGFSLLLFGILVLGGYYLNKNYIVSYNLLCSIGVLILVISNLILYLVASSKISYFIRDQETV